MSRDKFTHLLEKWQWQTQRWTYIYTQPCVRGWFDLVEGKCWPRCHSFLTSMNFHLFLFISELHENQFAKRLHAWLLQYTCGGAVVCTVASLQERFEFEPWGCLRPFGLQCTCSPNISMEHRLFLSVKLPATVYCKGMLFGLICACRQLFVSVCQPVIK